MHILSEAFVLLIAAILYLCCRERRKYLKRRIGSRALYNVYQTCRNIGFMLRRSDLSVSDDTSVLKGGGILFSFHFGVWELMPRALQKMGYDLGVISNRYSDSKESLVARLFDRLLYRFRARDGVKIFYRTDTMEIVRFLKGGGIIGMLVDGNDFYSKLGKAQKLSYLCCVPLVPFVAYRKNGRGILKIGCNIDKFVKERPYDYIWFYKSRSAA